MLSVHFFPFFLFSIFLFVPPPLQNIRAMEREEDADGEGHPLLEAVQSCIAAAAGEFDVERQQVPSLYSTVQHGTLCIGHAFA